MGVLYLTGWPPCMLSREVTESKGCYPLVENLEKLLSLVSFQLLVLEFAAERPAPLLVLPIT